MPFLFALICPGRIALAVTVIFTAVPALFVVLFPGHNVYHADVQLPQVQTGHLLQLRPDPVLHFSKDFRCIPLKYFLTSSAT